MAKRVSAYVCLAVGVAGVLLPIIPGIPFLILGYKLLGPDDWLAKKIASVVNRRQQGAQ